MDDLERILPSDITNFASRSGNELVLPLDEAKQAVLIASRNLIAILGDGLKVETYSGYDLKFEGNQEEYVRLTNNAALNFIRENSFGAGHGYILTATSEYEFRELSTRR
jgi:hypothetical protein